MYGILSIYQGLGSKILWKSGIYLEFVGQTKRKKNMHKRSNPHVTNFEVIYFRINQI